MKLKIIGLGGSLAENSTSLAALKAALAAAEQAGADTQLFDVRQLSLPLYDPAIEEPKIVHELAQAIEHSDAMIWSTPLYHGAMSGSFKNALDWLEVLAEHDPPYLGGRPVGLIATAGGAQGLQAVNSMEYVVRALRGYTVPFVVPVDSAWKGFTPKTEERLASLANEVLRSAQAMRVMRAKA